MDGFHFSGGLRLAIEFVLALQQRGKTHIDPSLVQPTWCNFGFFSDILPSKVRRIRRVNQTADSLGYWEVEREIVFHIQGHCVAVLRMKGQQVDKGENTPRHSAWAVSHLDYALEFSSPKEGPKNWIVVDWAPGGYTVTDLSPETEARRLTNALLGSG